jgi:hypothetical protein
MLNNLQNRKERYQAEIDQIAQKFGEDDMMLKNLPSEWQSSTVR